MNTSLRTTILCVLIVFATQAGLIGCGQSERSRPVGAMGDLMVYTDDETGCQYVKPNGVGGITPRLAADGKPICVGKR